MPHFLLLTSPKNLILLILDQQAEISHILSSTDEILYITAENVQFDLGLTRSAFQTEATNIVHTVTCSFSFLTSFPHHIHISCPYSLMYFYTATCEIPHLNFISDTKYLGAT